MKQSCIALITLYLCNISLAQNRSAIKFQYKESVKLNLPTSEKISYCLSGNTFYYCSRHFKTKINGRGQLTMYSYSFENRRFDSFLLSIPYTESLFSYSISSISIDDKNIVISSDSLYVFNSNRKLMRTANKHNSDNASLVGDNKILMLKNYNSHPLDDTIKSKLIVYNFEKDKIENYIKPHFRYFLYTHFVSNFFSCSNKYVAFAQTIPYKIDLYSKYNLKIGDSITMGSLYNSAGTIERLDSIHLDYMNYLNPKKTFYELKVIDTTVRRIEKIHFLNDNLLLVCKRFLNAKFEKRTLDVWKYTGNAWREIVSDQLYQTERPENDNYIITPESLPLDLTYSDKLLTRNNEIIVLEQMVPPTMNTPNNERKKYQDEYYSSNDLNYFLWIYKWEIK